VPGPWLKFPSTGNPPLLVTSTILGDAEAHLHIAPPKLPPKNSSAAPRKPLEGNVAALLCELSPDARQGRLSARASCLFQESTGVNLATYQYP
jgi:hypothetical protein